jgi:AmmeMemoRadiSam system protein B
MNFKKKYYLKLLNGMYRRSTHAGIWYSKVPKKLSANVKKMLNEAKLKNQINGKFKALIVPHAGMSYSG